MQRIAIDCLGDEPARALMGDVLDSVAGAIGLDAFQLGGPMPEGLLFRVVFQCPKGLKSYCPALACLVRLNRWYRANGWGDFSLYRSGVRYADPPPGQPPGAELWQSIPALHVRGAGDCVCLSAARAAELPSRKKPRLDMFEQGPNSTGGTLYHVVVRTREGLEDPSTKVSPA